jgi:transketolase
MEGVASEAASLAGHLGLDNLIYLYDDNRITIDGSTDLAFSEDRAGRFEAYGWFVQEIDGHNHDEIDAALHHAKEENTKPSLITARTHIAHGAPTLQDSSDSHGAPLGEEEVGRIRKIIGWPDQPFHVPGEVRELFERRKDQLLSDYGASQEAIERARSEDARFREAWDAMLKKHFPEDMESTLLETVGSKAEATRVSSGNVLQAAARLVPGLCGGSADLAPSNKTVIKDDAVVCRGNFTGRNFHFGVREHAMGGICNGMALYGGWIPYAGTFLIFADYMRPAIRLAALMGLQVIYVFTHDSLFVGEDGPTHQPVEQIASLRAIPGLVTLRPADPTETAAAWAVALRRTEGPTALCLTRQGVSVLDRTRYPAPDHVAKGAYVLSDCPGEPDILIIATGSEVHLALQAQSALAEEGTKTRVVSMPSHELFEAQNPTYRESILPSSVTNRVVIEAASGFGWDRYLSSRGLMIGMGGFGKSAPGKVLAESLGFTVEEVVKRIRETFC